MKPDAATDAASAIGLLPLAQVTVCFFICTEKDLEAWSRMQQLIEEHCRSVGAPTSRWSLWQRFESALFC